MTAPAITGYVGRRGVRVWNSSRGSAQITFDRIVAVRVLSEAERAIPGQRCGDRVCRLVEVGESLNLRVRTLDGTLDDMLTFARQGIPVATCLDKDGDAFHWLLVTEVRGRKVCIPALAAAGEEGWVSVSAAAAAGRAGTVGPSSLGHWSGCLGL